MAKDKVPDLDHLMRYVPRAQQVRHPDDNRFMGIVGTAFSLRPEDKGALSLTWVEHYGKKSTETYSIAASKFRDSLRSKKLATQAYFAVGQAGVVKQTSAKHGKQVRLVHAPDGANTGHVEMRRFNDEDRLLLDEIALDVFTEHVAVADLDLRPTDED